MKKLFACACILTLSACSATKNLPQTCEQQLKNLTSLEQSLMLVRSALEDCAAQVPPPVQ